MPRARRSESSVDASKRESAERISALADVVGKSTIFRPAREVLKRVRAVPTLFPNLDWKLRVKGWPIERLVTIHGASGEGKTYLTHGLGLSFLKREHYYLFVDAERTTPITWMEEIMAQYADSPLFLAARPKTYEQTVLAVRTLLNQIAEARAKGKVSKNTSAIVVVDSLRKLIPADWWEKIAKAETADREEATEAQKKGNKAKGVDGYGGRAAQIKAKLNSAWVDELIPLLDDTSSSLVFIAREYENTDADMWAPEWKVGGGQAVYFDSSLVGRVNRRLIYGPKDKKTGRGVLYGEKHNVVFRKTKVGASEEKDVYTYFHTSKGTLVPAGFDTARDLFNTGVEMGLIKKLGKGGKGSWFGWEKKRWNGEHAAVKKLTFDSMAMGELEEAIRSKFNEGPDQ